MMAQVILQAQYPLYLKDGKTIYFTGVTMKIKRESIQNTAHSFIQQLLRVRHSSRQ